MSARTLLAFDTAGRGCSAAVWRDGAVLAADQAEMARGQAERLVPMIESVLQRADVAHADLDAVAVTTGPGAFTGVRIGLATARGYALALGIPVIGIGSLRAIAAGTDPAERAGRILLVLIDAKRTDVYAQAFHPDLSPASEAMAKTPDALDAALPPGDLLLAGDGGAQAALTAAGRRVVRAGAPALVDPAVLAQLAAWEPVPSRDAPPRPVYLRPPDVTWPAGAGPAAPIAHAQKGSA
ncbi:tRNA (adenosine(37)-N6)-threonylcarbamoyltransferase complex dimerization subunit type 1 TsaB [Rhodovibrio salinarum]|uniref:tRNA (Adenosine(37)-N6)-threonylcarbamoyltransferase complex dimerization subunit type 1 TsaB n=1 Tax=Rhodovibrio salinarum TaxID=1087 RepID=A0A934QGY9_9PROT|nr:tRNA (adenosine(37)-N6)-threonylcarbamoyltransferase complex dimerization subunit type 1 TsaB [Rhodovibrio salinarum]MBK1696801.1 tRNA (adenosine(37)-N6)-threonylcarbamoyltransferase complex dimerization subunit type 1 TsaB [Rhodovibrio salinarum]